MDAQQNPLSLSSLDSGAASASRRTMPGNASPDALGTIDQYVLKKKIGGGGFGVVYLAEDSFTHVKYALKTIHPAMKRDTGEMARLKENFAIVQKLHHPHVADAMVIHLARDVQFFSPDVEKDMRLGPGDPVMVMSYAPGATLSAWRKQFPRGRVPLEKAVEICSQVADALDYAHRQRVVHRDVKPGNIVVAERGGALDAQVLDFGLAAEIRSSMNRGSGSTGVGDTSGTRPYMAPEQWTGDEQDGRTDQYALAVVLYELVSGAVPFEGVFRTGDVPLMLEAVEKRPPLSVRDLSPAQNRALRKALAKSRADRYPSCAAFVAAFAGRPVAGGSSSGAPTSLRGSFARSVAMMGPFFRAFGQWLSDGATRALCAVAARWPRAGALLDRCRLLPDSFFDGGDAQPGPGDISGKAISRPASADAASRPASSPSASRSTRRLASLPPPVVTPVDLGGGLSFDMADLHPGVFTMGSPHSEVGRRPGESLHEVTLSPFQLAAAPVTRAKWHAVMEPATPRAESGDGDYPMTEVSWDDIQTFLAVLNRDHSIRGYEWKLPTEAQWEYACRAGTSGPYGGTGLVEEMAWYAGNSDGAPHPVRAKKPNAWGLYDMNGGVWEWCRDAWTPSLGNAPATDPCHDGVSADRVARGGSWAHSAALARSASRMKLPRTARFDNVGFRVALVPR